MNAEDRAALLRPSKVAERCDVSLSTLRRWDREGVLRAVRLGSGTIRYHLEEVENFIASGGTVTRHSAKGARA